jgi:heme A synthase
VPPWSVGANAFNIIALVVGVPLTYDRNEMKYRTVNAIVVLFLQHGMMIMTLFVDLQVKINVFHHVLFFLFPA